MQNIRSSKSAAAAEYAPSRKHGAPFSKTAKGRDRRKARRAAIARKQSYLS